MKFKILVSSSSGLDYIPHSNSRGIIHDIIHYSEDEEYADFIEMKSEAFYNRLKFDKKSVPTVLPATREEIVEQIEKALKDIYDFVIIILPAKGIVDYEERMEEVKVGFENSVRVIQSNLVGYALASMIIDLEKSLKSSTDYEAAISVFDKANNESVTLFYSPLKDFKINFDEYVIDEQFFYNDKNGSIYMLDCSTLVKLKLKSEKHPIKELFKRYLALGADLSVVPFIMYSSEYSRYNDYFEMKILGVYKKLKKIKSYPLPPSIGALIGANVISIGFVNKN